jgi:hypothetical protein
MITARVRSSLPALPPQVGLAVAGVAASGLVLAAPLLPFGDLLRLDPPSRALLLASAASVALTTLLAPNRVGRWELAAAGLGALGGQALLMALTDPLAVAALLVLIGFAFATRPSRRSFVSRVRGPAFTALLVGAGWTFLHTASPSWLGRVGALALALGLVACAGLVPYLADVDPDEPASSSYLAWIGFFGPALALSLPARVLPGMPVSDAPYFGATLVGLGLVNLAWGTVGAWRTASDMDAWRCSFLVDWGLALVGIGLLLPAGRAAAYLALLSIVLVRVPLYLWARPALLRGEPGQPGRFNGILVVLLAGAAPFSGFPIRLLVLGAATQEAWQLAIPLVLAMLLAIASATRLARTLGAQGGRAAAGMWVTVGLSVLLGLAPGLARLLAGL